MVQSEKKYTIRQAGLADEHDLRWLIQRRSFVHRHLDWGSPLAWLGKQPFYLLEEEIQGLVAALAFPRDEDGIVWLRLFAVAPGFSVALAWRKLWEAGLEWHQEYSSDSLVTSLATYPEMEKILFSTGFTEINQVISLVWDVSTARWPDVNKEFDDKHEIVIRRTDFHSNRTLGIRADKVAVDINRELVEKLKDPSTKAVIEIDGL